MKIFWHLYIHNPILFAGQAITNWRVVGSIFPSSAPLRKAVIKNGFGEQKHFELVILHGIGSGEFVYEILRQAHERKISISRLVVMDVNAKFITNTSRFLPVVVARYPSQTKVTFEIMDALNTPQYIANNNFDKADLVIGTIPYSNLPQAQLDEWAKMYASITKRFVYYTYLQEFKPPKHIESAGIFRQSLAKYFGSVSEQAKILANIPSAKVIVANQG